MATYAYLLDPNKQYMTKSGSINVAGSLRVYDAATDDAVITYKDFNGTENEESIILDNNGRAVVIADSARAYRLEVYDRYGSLQWTVSPLWCLAAGGGVAIHDTEVISTDGSIDVDKVTVGSTTTFNIGISPNDSDEFLEWVKCSNTAISNGTLYPTYEDGSMETYAGQGLHVGKDKFYHITCTIKVDPTGAGINYETLSANLKFNDGTDIDLVRRNYDIDNSVHDPVLCEFSYDFKAPSDGYLYLYIEGVNTFEQVDCELQVHRIYSGINAVPDTCATKQWVQDTFDYNMSSKVDYSAIEYNQNNEITGISGSAIAAGSIDSAFVSGVASAYAESAASSKLDQSSSGMFAPSGNYYSATNPSGFITTADLTDFAKESALSSKLDASASSMFAPSGDYVFESAYSAYTSEVTNNISSLSSNVSGISANMSAYVPFSGLEGEGGKVTGISGSAFKGHEYTGISPVTVDNTADTISVEHRTLCVDSTMTAYTSGDSAVIGVNVAGLDLSSKMDASASSLFYSTSNPSGFITGVDLTPYQLTADMSAYAHESSLSSKLDASASSEFYPSSNPSGFLTAHQSLAGYATEAYVDSSVSSKLDTTAFSTVSGDFLTSHQSLAGYATESYVDSAVSGKLDVTASSQFLTSLPDDLAYTSDVASAVSSKMDKTESSSFYPMDSNPSGYLTAHQSLAGYATETYVDSAVSSKLDATAYDSAEFYTTANPSGFITGVDLTPYQLTADMSAYSHESSLSAKLDASASSDFYSTANPSGFVDGASASAIASAYQVVSATATQLNAGTAYLTSVNETPISAARAGNAANASLATSAWYDGTGRLISSLPDEATVSSIASAYAESAANGKLDESASSNFYSTSNPSGFITGVDLTPYQLTADMSGYYTTANESGYVDSAYVEGQVSGKQDASAMTAYQPSGDYIYVSALGWAEV